MFDVKRDRLNYGDLLMPPSGYELNKAIATTYSLDLETLTAACVSSGLEAATDSILVDNKITAYNAIEKVSRKLVVFCEAGQLSVPAKPSPLYQLFEKCIVPVALPKQLKSDIYPSFHPKTWLLEYKSKEDGKDHDLYRFIVMSRNLTSDRSLDISVMLEGEVERKGRKESKAQPLVNFLDFLKKQIPTKGDPDRKHKLQIVSDFTNLIRQVHFKASEQGHPFSDFVILPSGINEVNPFENEDLFSNQSYHDLFVCSPFLSANTIKLLNSKKTLKETNRGVLITRKTELPKIKDVASNFDVYIVKDDIVYGENNLPDGVDEQSISNHDIHAKIYLCRKGSTTNLYIGSMNASERGTGIFPGRDKFGQPINVEMMLKLVTTRSHLDLDDIKKDLLLGENESIFMKYGPEEFPTCSSQDEVQSRLLQKIKTICRMGLTAKVSGPDSQNLYGITVEARENVIHEKFMISPVYAPRKVEILKKEIEFDGLELRELSELYKIQVKEKDTVLEKLILIPTSNMPVERERAIINYVISTKKEFSDYIAFMLGEDAVQTLSDITNEKYGTKASSHTTTLVTSLYERMIQTACLYPERLKEIGKVVAMIEDENIVPDTFTAVYNTFMKALKYDTGRNQ